MRVHSEWGVVDGTDFLAGGDERITTTDYAHDTNRWLLGRPTHVLVTDADGARVAESRTFYDGDPFVGLPLGTLGARGLPTRTESWVDGDRFVNTTRVQYDEFGLATATLDPRGFRREVDYDPDTHRFPVAERLLLGNGRVLAFTAGYDPVAGLVSWYEDPSAGSDDLPLHAAAAAGVDREGGGLRRQTDARLRVPLRQPHLRGDFALAHARWAETPCSRSTTTTMGSAATSDSSSRPRTARP